MTSTAIPPQTGAVRVLGEAHRVLLELDDVFWAARDNGEKMDAVVAIEELRSVLDSIELDVVRDLEASRGPEKLGWVSTRDFVTAAAGEHKGAGPAMVRLAQALDQPVLAPVAQAQRDGWLSTAKAHVIARAIDRLPSSPEVRGAGVQTLLDEAKKLDATDLGKAARHLVEVVDPEGTERREERERDREERGAHLGRHFSIRDDGAGGAFIRGRCSSEDAAQIRSTLMPLSRPLPTSVPDCDPKTCDLPGCGHDGRDPRDHGARMLDALVEALRLLQGADVLPDSHGAVPRINIVMDLDDLREQTGAGAADTGEDLSPQAVRRMSCDADIIPVVLGGGSEVLDVGRHQRLASVAIWRALVARDRHCRFTGCTRPPVMCHAHHVQHWVDGGATCLDNMVLLCSHHHRLVHSGPWTITQPAPGDFRFHPPDAVRRARGPRPGGLFDRSREGPGDPPVG
jgi:hypothetical protein